MKILIKRTEVAIIITGKVDSEEGQLPDIKRAIT